MTILAAVAGCSAAPATEEEDIDETEDGLTLIPRPQPTLQTPRFLSLSVSSGPPGTQLTINGAFLGNWGAMTVRYGNTIVPYTRVPNTQNIVVTVPANAAAGARPFTATFANSPFTASSPNFTTVIPPIPTTGTIHLINHLQWRATSIVLDGTTQLLPPNTSLPSTGQTQFANIPNGQHSLTVTLGANLFAQSNMFTWTSGVFTISGNQRSLHIPPAMLGELLTNFQPSTVFHLVPVPSGVSYTIQRSGSWVWRNNNTTPATIFPGVGVIPTSWPADALVIEFNFSDGTPASYNLLTQTLIANGTEAYGR